MQFEVSCERIINAPVLRLILHSCCSRRSYPTDSKIHGWSTHANEFVGRLNSYQVLVITKVVYRDRTSSEDN